MTIPAKPAPRPSNPCFSSGPCAKRPGWTPKVLQNAVLGRSHRAKIGKQRLNEVIDQSREILGLPDDYVIGIVPASDTGAVEMALWSLLGQRGVDMLAWESFGSGWVSDVLKQLKLEGVTEHFADYGKLPDLTKVNFDNDVVFTWNGTTSGVRVPNGDWIDADRKGLTICDATSAAFAMDLPWDKLDVVTYSWQKVLGGEAQHGMLVLSPRAVERLETYTPAWPMPKIFRLTKGGKLMAGVFKGETINTPSMLAVEDAVDGLQWAKSVGGLKGLIGRANSNAAAIAQWVDGNADFEFLAEVPETRSTTSVCLKITAPWLTALSDKDQDLSVRRLTTMLDEEAVAYDITYYRDAPAGLRIWAGATIETSDLKAIFPWIEWALECIRLETQAASGR
ncbi:MAG: phosphoserine transaminase, partial [Rhodospirillales bacterium]|nr:phosphoserine transaminase [Rhodospirillales bacterium]